MNSDSPYRYQGTDRKRKQRLEEQRLRGYIVAWQPRSRPKETKAERKERTRMRLFRQGIVLRRYQHAD